MLGFLKNHLNDCKDNMFECFLRSIIDFFLNFFFMIYNDGKSKA